MSDPILSTGTSEVRPAHRFDEQRLFEWMRVNVDGFTGPLKVEQFRGGQSNPTYRLFTPGRSYVLRRKPPGDILPGAHAIEREARVLQALRKVGPLYFDAMNATIAVLHQVDFGAIGLSDYGKPGNYFARQISRWTNQYLKDVDAGRDPHLDRLIEWLPANIPKGDDISLVHGDFRADNLIFHPTDPRVIAVLDWELSTLGHPLADFAYHLMMYRMPFDVFAGLKGHDLGELNIPSESQYVDAYCRRTGREGIPDLDFYVVFNMFRLAAIFHGIKGRLIRGNAASAHAADAAAKLPLIAEQAWLQTGAA